MSKTQTKKTEKSKLTLHYDLLSQPSRAVWLFLKCSKVEFEAISVSLMKGEHKTEDYKKKNPFQKVPVINDDGFILTESAAIMRYIANKYKLTQWYPQDEKKRARVDEFLHWQQTGIRKPCLDVFLELIKPIGPNKEPIDEKKVQLGKEEIAKSVAQIDSYFLAGKDFIAGSTMTVADILGASELYQLHGVNLLVTLVESNKNVAAWMKRVQEGLKPHFEEAAVVVKGIREQMDKYNASNKGQQQAK